MIQNIKLGTNNIKVICVLSVNFPIAIVCVMYSHYFGVF